MFFIFPTLNLGSYHLGIVRPGICDFLVPKVGFILSFKLSCELSHVGRVKVSEVLLEVQASIFLADRASGCQKLELGAGDTLLL